MAEPTDTAVPTLKRESIRRQVLAVLALGVVLALLLAGAIAQRHGMFARTAEVYFLADSAAGIAPGISVRLSGFRVGSVTDVVLQPDLKVKVTMNIEEERASVLRSDAHAEWFKEQLQAAVIDLQPGTAAQPLSRGDPRVSHSRRRTLTEVANDLRSRLAPILDDVKQLSGSAASRKDDIAEILANARLASQELAGTTQQLRALAGDAKARVASLGGQAQGAFGQAQGALNQLQGVMGQAQGLMGQAQGVMGQGQAAMGQVQGALGQVQGALTQANQTLLRVDTLVGQADKTLANINDKLPTLLTRAGDTLEQLNGVARDVRAVSSAASASLPSALRSVTPLVDDAREMVNGVKTSWPVRNMLAPPPSALQPIDSHDAGVLREPGKR
jgi:phospholipid/cholesterol/gamma-HCH transport system substrate-binding protein